MTDQMEERRAEGQLIMPFYIICDVSASMAHDMTDLNKALSDVHRQLLSEPIIADLVMLSVISFNHGARSEVPLAALEDITMPTLKAGGSTDYSAALREFAQAFAADRARLKGEGKRVYRPCVYFLTDGEPNDDSYRQVFASQLAKDKNDAYPYVCAFGFRAATAATLKTLAYPDFGEDSKRGRYFIARDGATITEVLTSMAGVLAQSILQSGQSAGSGSPMVSLPGPQSVSGMGGSFV